MEHPLITVWVCSSLAILIMASRLVLGRWCKAKFNSADALTIAAIFLSLARVAFTHVIVVWRTNNIAPSLGEGLAALSDRAIYQREIGSKLTLVARCIYILLLWIQKSVLLSFYSGIVENVICGRRVIFTFRLLLVATFVPCIVVTFTGCRPFDHYWILLPDTDECTEAITQLFVVGALNIFTDLLLIILPIPVLAQIQLSLRKKAQLGFLFSVGFFVVIITAVRIPRTLHERTSESNRISWTTAEFLVATFVANAPTLYGFRNRLRRRKPEMRRSSRSGPHIRVVLSGTTNIDEEDKSTAEGTSTEDGGFPHEATRDV